MFGYKVFNPDWTCRGFQFAVDETFEEDVIPSCCHSGFHFCTELKDCFNYYSFDPNNKVAEIEALGKIDAEADGSKHCTNKIKIIREISWEEVLKLINMGIGNSGRCNSGSCNSGNYNSGNWNSGDYNSGSYNSNDGNSGSYNSGNHNSGDSNSGDSNSGNYNSGNRNSGNWNSGEWNSGNGNSGDWNKTNFSSGCFNTKESKILMFNKPSNWTLNDWYKSEARYLLNNIKHDAVVWIWSNDMTDEEKEQHPEYIITEGYFRKLDKPESSQIWWNNLSDRQKSVIKSLPNFDAKIFKECTGVTVD